MGQTPNIGLYQTAHGGDVDTWDVPLNANDGATDYLFANVAQIVIPTQGSPYSYTLTSPPGTDSSWAGPYQAQSALLRFTGILNNNALITIPRAGFFMVENLCTANSSAWYVQFQASGKKICAPPGEIVHIFYDGTDFKYLDMGRVGSYIDIAASAMPSWITNCTVPPYLNCDGTTFSSGTYPQLSAILGGTTLPDARGRFRGTLNQTTGRLSGGGVNGDVLLSNGGNYQYPIAVANIPNYNLSVSDPQHAHHIGSTTTGAAPGGNPVINAVGPGGLSDPITSFAATGITVSSGGSGSPLAVTPPTYVGGLTLIRAG